MNQEPHTAVFSVTVSDTGQVTIPEPLRERYHLTPGTEVQFSGNGNGELVVRVRAGGNREESLASWLEASAGLGAHLGKCTDEILQVTRSEI